MLPVYFVSKEHVLPTVSCQLIRGNSIFSCVSFVSISHVTLFSSEEFKVQLQLHDYVICMNLHLGMHVIDRHFHCD